MCAICAFLSLFLCWLLQASSICPMLFSFLKNTSRVYLGGMCACVRVGVMRSWSVDSQRAGSSSVDNLSATTLWSNWLSLTFHVLPPPPLWSQLPLLSNLWPKPKAKVGRLLPRQQNRPAAPGCWPREPQVTLTIIICSPLPPASSSMNTIWRSEEGDAGNNGRIGRLMGRTIERTKEARVRHWKGEQL